MLKEDIVSNATLKYTGGPILARIYPSIDIGEIRVHYHMPLENICFFVESIIHTIPLVGQGIVDAANSIALICSLPLVQH